MESKNDVNENDTTNSKDNVMDNTDVQTMFEELHKKALEMGIKQDMLSRLQYVKNTKRTKKCRFLFQLFQLTLTFTATLVACGIIWRLDWPVSRSNLAHIFWRLQGYYTEDVVAEECLVQASFLALHLLHPPIDCTFCRNVNEITRVANITSLEFEDKYAYTGHPIVISDGAANWTAKDVFSYDFFKEIYAGRQSHTRDSNCQFLDFNAEFTSLQDVFHMDEKRASNEDGSDPWYIGWSNCDTRVGKFLRDHYSIPYFLPSVAETTPSDWIFMGTPGYGAHMHVDNVLQPSWQAQIAGHKEWTLESPSECYLKCASRLTVTVHPGEIIVLDTNKWYHATRIVGDSLSITIGAEFD